MRRNVSVIGIALAVAMCALGCAPSPQGDVSGSTATAPPANVDVTGILLVDVGEQIQPVLPTEPLKVAFSRAIELAQAHGDDLGYPWFDSSSGELVLSVATSDGRALLEGLNIEFPHRVREVPHGAAELARIQDEVTRLRSQGVPGAELIYAAAPDYRDNRVLIVISQMSRPLLDALAERFPVDAIAVRVDPSGGLGVGRA